MLEGQKAMRGAAGQRRYAPNRKKNIGPIYIFKKRGKEKKEKIQKIEKQKEWTK